MNKSFGNMRSFATFLEERIPAAASATTEVAEVASVILYERVRETYGDKNKLAPLSPATQEERESKGYTPDDPLLRDGELLRASVERVHEGPIGGAASSEPIAAYHEFGFINHETGKPVPARPVFEIALHEAETEVVALLERAVGIILGER